MPAAPLRAQRARRRAGAAQLPARGITPPIPTPNHNYLPEVTPPIPSPSPSPNYLPEVTHPIPTPSPNPNSNPTPNAMRLALAAPPGQAGNAQLQRINLERLLPSLRKLCRRFFSRLTVQVRPSPESCLG